MLLAKGTAESRNLKQNQRMTHMAVSCQQIDTIIGRECVYVCLVVAQHIITDSKTASTRHQSIR